MIQETAKFPNPRRVLAVWSGALLLIATMLSLYTLLLHQQVEAMRLNSPWHYLKQAEEMSGLKNFPAALRLLEKAAELDLTDPVPHERAGIIHYDSRAWQEALGSYTKALNLGSPVIDTRGKIIWCLIQMNRYLEAAQFGERCIQEKQYSDSFYRDIGEAYRRAGKVPEAIGFYEEARRVQPKDLALIMRLVELYTASGEQDKAKHMQQLLTDLESAA